MHKLKKPQIYVFDNETIVNKLKDTHSVSEGTIGIISEAVLSAREQNRYFNLKYGWDSNIHEYDIFVIDLQEQRKGECLSQNEEPVDRPYLFKVSYPKIKCDPAPLALTNLRSHLDDKKLRIIFAGSEIKEEYSIVEVYGKSDYSYPETHTYGIYDTEHTSTHNRHGKIVRVEDSILKPLLEKHVIGYDVAFSLPTKRNPDTGKWDADTNYIPLAFSKDEQVVAYFSFSEDLGYTLVLPICKEKDELVKSLIDDILPVIVPDIVPESQQFSWLKDVSFKNEEQILLEQKKADLEKEYKVKMAEIDKSIEANTEKYKFLQKLLIETGEELVEALKTYFEWLGFCDVRIVDGSEEKLREDLQILDGDDLYIIEIKGIGGTSTDAECAQIGKHRRKREKEYRDKTIYPFYVVNHQRYRNPKERENPPFSDDQISYAECDERGLLTTWELYKKYWMIEKGIFTKEETRGALKEIGLMTLLPDSIKKVGTFTEYYKKPRAGIMVIDNEIKVSDEVLCEKNGEWLKATVLSIKADDKEVDAISQGEIGIVLDAELSKGYNIYKRY